MTKVYSIGSLDYVILLTTISNNTHLIDILDESTYYLIVFIDTFYLLIL